MQYEYLIGIDEAGRGPLAGPVSVGVVCVAPNFNWALIPGVDDSKKLTPEKREALYEQACLLQENKQLHFAVCMESAAAIDRFGIVPSIRKAMRRALRELESELQFDASSCSVKLDGSLTAPEDYGKQETIIGGDGKEKVIGLASVVAKVTRDRYMVSKIRNARYAQYAFDQHKGYGTQAHLKLIKAHGLCDIHRKSYCTRIDTQM